MGKPRRALLAGLSLKGGAEEWTSSRLPQAERQKKKLSEERRGAWSTLPPRPGLVSGKFPPKIWVLNSILVPDPYQLNRQCDDLRVRAGRATGSQGAGAAEGFSPHRLL